MNHKSIKLKHINHQMSEDKPKEVKKKSFSLFQMKLVRMQITPLTITLWMEINLRLFRQINTYLNRNMQIIKSRFLDFIRNFVCTLLFLCWVEKRQRDSGFRSNFIRLIY
jgi:hypothetical protein